MDILSEFEGLDREIGEQLMRSRQPASPALRRRVMAITKQPAQAKPSPLRRAFALSLIGILCLLLLLTFPQVRASATRIFVLLQRRGLADAVSSGINGVLTLSPTPIFTVRQPGSLPDGFTRSAVHYRSHIQALVTEQISDTSSDPILAARLEAYESDAPYLLIGYQAPGSRYLLLFQRAAVAGEELTGGSSLTINGSPAVLRIENDIRIVTWIANGTWITLETNTTESDLIEVAQGLVVTQQPENAALDISETSELPLCDSDNLKSQRFLLGKLDDQVFWGSIWIYLYEGDTPDSVAHGMDAEVTEAMLLQRGLDALRDPRLAGQALSTEPDIIFEFSSEQPCLKPDSDLMGYVVLEVWEKQVNAAFVGGGDDLRDRAINALANELAK